MAGQQQEYVNTIECCDNRDLILGLEAIPDGAVNHVLTDPPYEDDAHEKQRRQDYGKGIKSAPLTFDSIDEKHRRYCCAQWKRVCTGWVIVFCQAEAIALWKDAMTDAGIAWKRAALWLKTNAMPQFTGDRPAQGYESIAIGWAGAGRSSWNGGGKPGVYRSPRGTGGRHQTEKPLALMESLVRDFTQPGDLVLDPFAGTGTTLVACKRMGRRWCGMEREPKYAQIARARIMEAREQIEMFGGTA